MSDATNTETAEFPSPKDVEGENTGNGKRTVTVEFGAKSHIGNVRTNNEDHFLITKIGRSFRVLRTSLPDGELPAETEDVAYGMVVADGMGGMAAGERASLMAIRTGVSLVLESPNWTLKIDDEQARRLIDRLRQYFHKVDEALIEQTKVDPELSGMGTTLTVAYTVGLDAFIVHAGDSRAYLFRDDELRQLTRDHTLAQSLVDLAGLPPNDARTLAVRHILTNVAGGPQGGIEPEVATVTLRDGDRLLLCTDGLTGMVEDSEIAAILRQSPNPEENAETLVARALEHGGNDNVTVILARYQVIDES